VVITDTTPAIIAVNEAYTTITGYSVAETLGRTQHAQLRARRQGVLPYDVEGHPRPRLLAGRGLEPPQERRDLPQLLTISTVYNDKQEPMRYIGVFSDITQLKENQAQLEFMAHHDR